MRTRLCVDWRTARAARAAFVAATVCAALLLSGCVVITDGSPDVFGLKAKKASAKRKPEKSSGPARVGESQSVGSWHVTVNSAEREKRLTGVRSPGGGKELLLIDVGFRNDGADPLIVLPKDFSLKSRSGKTVKMASAPAAYNAQSMRSMGLGFRGGTVLVYRIPKGSGGYTLTVKLKPASKKTKRLRWRVP